MTMTDDQLMADLARALVLTDPVPATVTEFAKASFDWRDIDAQMAELVYDSAEAGLVGVRGDEQSRQLTFRAPGVEIEVELVSERSRRIVGQLVPPQETVVELRFDGSALETTTDRLGRFSFDDVPTGPISLRCNVGDDQSVRTDWVLM
ncbi:MAG: hypothetical protein M3349_09145 [Actinomycetota bacterium]|nr:hypothetical protein [Actinomycetota bacterium]